MDKKIWIIGAICLVVGVLLGVGVISAVNFFTKPINEPLAIQTTTPSETAEVEPEVEEEADEVEEEAVVEEPTPEPETEKVCGHDGSLTILLTGADATGGNPPYGADAIRVMKVDFSNQSVDVLTIPRDLVVQLNGIAPDNQGENAIGEAYWFEKEAIDGTDKEKVEKATNFLAQTLVDNFNLESNHYLTLQLDSIEAMVDAIGGVEIFLPTEIVSERDMVFPAGKQVLNGEQATEFLRTKLPGGDAARADRQTLFLDASQDQVLSTGTIVKAPELFEQFQEAITTDLSPKLITDMVCLMEKVTPASTKYYVIPNDMVSLDEETEKITIIDEAGLLDFIGGIFD